MTIEQLEKNAKGKDVPVDTYPAEGVMVSIKYESHEDAFSYFKNGVAISREEAASELSV